MPTVVVWVSPVATGCHTGVLFVWVLEKLPVVTWGVAREMPPFAYEWSEVTFGSSEAGWGTASVPTVTGVEPCPKSNLGFVTFDEYLVYRFSRGSTKVTPLSFDGGPTTRTQ